MNLRAEFKQVGIFHLVLSVYANRSHIFAKFCFFEVITSPLYSIVIYSCTERQMIPQSFTQRLYIFFLILQRHLKVSCDLLSSMPNHKWSTLQLYMVLTLLNLTVIKPLLEEAVLYVGATDFLTTTWSSCNTPRYCNHWQPRHHHVFWLDSAGWMTSPMFLWGRPSLSQQVRSSTLPPWCWTTLLPWGDRWGKSRTLPRQILVDLCKRNPSENIRWMNEAWEIKRNNT